ncbi:NUDIX domain-containing protein [Paenibacillus taihuensis]|nr:NUDIX domain-containing protein [Paenibacillus taihuensis]
MEPGETIKETMIREVKEETGWKQGCFHYVSIQCYDKLQ